MIGEGVSYASSRPRFDFEKDYRLPDISYIEIDHIYRVSGDQLRQFNNPSSACRLAEESHSRLLSVMSLREEKWVSSEVLLLRERRDPRKTPRVDQMLKAEERKSRLQSTATTWDPNYQTYRRPVVRSTKPNSELSGQEFLERYEHGPVPYSREPWAPASSYDTLRARQETVPTRLDEGPTWGETIRWYIKVALLVCVISFYCADLLSG